MNPKLYPCPYDRATTCAQTEACNGCETWAAHHSMSSGADDILMPKALTVENGAMARLCGELYEEVTVPCPECWYKNEDADEDCEICHGTGEQVQSVPVSWTTIKEIYAMAVSRLGRPL